DLADRPRTVGRERDGSRTGAVRRGGAAADRRTRPRRQQPFRPLAPRRDLHPLDRGRPRRCRAPPGGRHGRHLGSARRRPQRQPRHRPLRPQTGHRPPFPGPPMHDNRTTSEDRVRRFLREQLPARRHLATAPLTIEAWEVPDEPVPFEEARRQTYTPVSVGDRWGRPWSTLWLHVTGQVPASWTT